MHNRQRLEVFDLSDGRTSACDELDFDTQRLVSHHFSLGRRAVEASVRSRSARSRRRSSTSWRASRGMTLRERWADWDRSPFTAESTKHVSVWEKPAG